MFCAGNPFDKMAPEDAAARGRTSGAGGDRLSGLRDEVLLRVLSHLKAWEAVRTCVLSQRWRDLWTYTGHLDIRQSCLCRRCGSAGCLSAYQRRARDKAFNSFVRKLLLLRRPLVPLISFRLCWTHETRDGRRRHQHLDLPRRPPQGGGNRALRQASQGVPDAGVHELHC